MREGEVELELVADCLCVASSCAKLRQRGGGLGGPKSASEGCASNHCEAMVGQRGSAAMMVMISGDDGSQTKFNFGKSRRRQSKLQVSI